MRAARLESCRVRADRGEFTALHPGVITNMRLMQLLQDEAFVDGIASEVKAAQSRKIKLSSSA